MIFPAMQQFAVLDADGESRIGAGMGTVGAFELSEQSALRRCLPVRPDEDEALGQRAGAAVECLAIIGQRAG